MHNKSKLLLRLFQHVFLCSDSDDEVPVKKSTKSPKEKQRSKKEAPQKKDPVQYVSETGDDTLGRSSTVWLTEYEIDLKEAIDKRNILSHGD